MQLSSTDNFDPLQPFHVLHQPCPSCTSSDGYSEAPDGHGHCFACGKHFPSKNSLFGNFTYEYLPLRGISKETLAFYDAKTKVDEEGKPVAIGFRYPNGAFKIRSLEKKEFRSERSPDGKSISEAGLFGRDRFSSGKTVTITEGELDALSLNQVIRSPVVSVQSSSTAGRDCTLDRSWLNNFDKIVLAFDADESGRKACNDVARLFDYNKVFIVKFDKRKDANEYVQAGEREELNQLWRNAKRFCPESIVSSLDEFKTILTSPRKQGYPFPFKQLTKMTYGYRKGESVLITALPKVGKTEVMHFIEHNHLVNTDENVGAIFLEEPKDRHLQALASIQIRKPLHLPDTDYSGIEASQALEQVVSVDDRLHIYSHFGSDDPNVLLDTIRFLVTSCKCNLILLDHLTMCVSGLAGEDERRALDYIATRLEMMVKELGFALIFVSHVNDHGQTRGSRIAGQICDTRIDITRNLNHPDDQVKKTWNINLAYSRFSGQSGDAGRVIFDMDTYSFQEGSDFAFATVAGNDNGSDQIHRAA